MLAPDQIFAHFKIIRLLGQGGMGQVYLAEDQKLHRQVALKVLTAEYFGDEERRERFYREARTAAQISHSNVMAIYDFGTTKVTESGQDVLYIVMEYIQGKPLNDYLKARPGDIAAAVRIAEKIASGLAAAHKINVVHRDIKADNIIVDDDEQPKILDFGLAKPLDPVQFGNEEGQTNTVSQELTKVGKILGTVSYMSPEQVRGEPVDTRSDVFSFGVLLYRMLTGEFPFAGKTEVSTLAKILEARHDSVRAKNDSIPPELERIIDKCLQKDPGDRYQDTRDLVVDLRNLRKQYDSGISDSHSAMRTGEMQQHIERAVKQKLNRARLIRLAIIIPALLISLGSWLYSHYNSDASEVMASSTATLAIIKFENKTNDTSFTWMETGLPEILTTDLAQDTALDVISGQRLADFARQQENPNSSEAWLAAAKSAGARTILSGTLYKMGNQIRIDARLEDAASGRILLGEKVLGSDPFSLVDSLSNKIAASLNVQRAAREASVAEITSSSPEAYKAYLAGMEKFNAELYDAAIREFERAIALDSTFALPYMRIGMANAFRNWTQQAKIWFGKAVTYKQKLPARERLLLEVYADIWLYQNFGEGYTRMQALVGAYPEDMEAKTIYAVLVNEFENDTAHAFALLDTVLAANPRYQIALSYYSQALLNRKHFERSADLARRLMEYIPDSPSGYTLLARNYLLQGKDEKAVEVYEEIARRFPNDPDSWSLLQSAYVRVRQFDKAEQALERFRVLSGDQPYRLEEYFNEMANLAAWKGQFRQGVKYLEQRVDQLVRATDTSRIALAMNELAGVFYRLEMSDSADYWYRRGLEWPSFGSRGDYYMFLVKRDPSTVDKIRPEFRKGMDEFRARLPKELWTLVENLDSMFEATAVADTAKLIRTIRNIARAQQQESGGNIRSLAELQAFSGEYDEAIKLLEPMVTGQYKSTSGWFYPYMNYVLGRAYEGKGNRKEAADHYQEMLKYWTSPDMEIKEIVDARQRLARLTS